jgi:serine/threonine protein kinase/Flp pilus assembly protein TadD
MSDSNPERWRRVREIFDAALRLPAEQRDEYLDSACAGDADLHRELASLLNSYSEADAFLEKPAVSSLSTLFGPGKSWEGKIVGPYRVVEEIGQGGMGVIYRAQDTRLGRSAALKFLPDDMTRDPAALSRFKREAQTASSLNHPHICTIYGVDEYEGHPYIAMEYLQGRMLKELTDEGPLPVERLLELAIQIADALDAAHHERIIHRDIKPSNIFVTQRGQAKVMDFGIAKKAPRPQALNGGSKAGTLDLELVTTPGAAMGTVAYMSPEQARGEDLDIRTDVFSFGALLYEMATGAPAFTGKTTAVIHDAILNRAPVSPSKLNPKVPSKLETVIFKSLEKDRKDRYQTAGELRADLMRLKRDIDSGKLALRESHDGNFSVKHWKLLAVVAVVVGALISDHISGPGISTESKHKLKERDAILVADFDNSTGDPVFDGALKKALEVKLDESPYFNVVPEDHIQQTLHYMGRQADERINAELGREICQRQNAAGLLVGAIARLGNHYIIELDASSCQNGKRLGSEQSEAESKEQVLRVMGGAASRLREKLGESRNSIEKYDTPIEEATTASLDALKAYSLGESQRAVGNDPGSLPFYRRALEIDPNFAMAYATLGTVYANMGETKLSAENARKAFELRTRVSERERFYIAAHYYGDSGQLDKSIEEYLIWEQSYPHDWIPRNNLCSTYASMGWFEKALPEGQKAWELERNDPLPYTSLAGVYMALNRYDGAQGILEGAKKIGERNHGEGLDDALFHGLMYTLAAVRGDEEAKRIHADWAHGRPEEMFLLLLQAQEAAAAGKLRLARSQWQRSAEIAEQNKFAEISALAEAIEAHWLAELGYTNEAKRGTATALAKSRGYFVEPLAADILARVGSPSEAQKLGAALEKRYGNDTLMNSTWIATARARGHLSRRKTQEAVKTLESALPYELGMVWQAVPFRTIYLRGQAYLRLGDGKSAAAEFQKIVDHRGVEPLSPYYPLAHLGLARAAAARGAKDESRQYYEKFFAFWKDADPDVALLVEAKREYGNLFSPKPSQVSQSLVLGNDRRSQNQTAGRSLFFSQRRRAETRRISPKVISGETASLIGRRAESPRRAMAFAISA